jgi:hypothetical protein
MIGSLLLVPTLRGRLEQVAIMPPKSQLSGIKMQVRGIVAAQTTKANTIRVTAPAIEIIPTSPTQEADLSGTTRAFNIMPTRPTRVNIKGTAPTSSTKENLNRIGERKQRPEGK